MKKILFVLLLLVSSTSNSQELVKELKIKLGLKTDAFQIVEEQKKQIAFFFSDKKSISTVRFNDNFNVIDSIAVSRPSKEYDAIVGYSITDNKYFAYWSDRKKMLAQCFDFDTKQVSSKIFPLEFGDEKVIKKITVNDVFYIITILKNSSVLNFYVYNNNTFEKKIIDLSAKRFLGFDNKTALLWDIIDRGTALEPSLFFQNISNESPPSLVFSSCKRKVYTPGNNIVFTIDISKRFTQLISINLTDFSFFQKSYNQPFVEENLNGSGVDSNSFFTDNKLIQMKLNTEKMLLSIKDLEGNELKSFEILDGKEIAFKNSEIIQENKNIKSTRVLDNSSQLLRKIYYQNPSISCYSFNNKKYLSIGSVSDPENGNANILMIGGMYGFVGALIAVAITSNYSMDNLNSYKGRKVVYINCLFDSDFNHVNGELKKLAFDELRLFADNNNKLLSQAVFKLNSNLYFGGYDDKKGTYSFYQFKD
jgi:hypothetical protein